MKLPIFFLYPLFPIPTIIHRAFTDLGAFWVCVMHSEYEILRTNLTTEDFSQIFPLEGRDFQSKTEVINFFKTVYKDFVTELLE
jgi:hypothetical protein